MSESAPTSGSLPAADLQDMNMVKHVVNDYFALSKKIKNGMENRRLIGGAWEGLAFSLAGTAELLNAHFAVKKTDEDFLCNLGCGNPVNTPGENCQACMDALRVAQGFPANPAAPATPFAELR